MTTLTDAVARAICWKRGNDPDVSLGGDKQNFLWMEYEDEARAAIAEFCRYLREPPEELQYQASFLRALATHIELCAAGETAQSGPSGSRIETQAFPAPITGEGDK